MSWQTRYVLGTLLLVGLAACAERDGKVTLTAAERTDTMSNVLFELERAQLTSNDPMLEEQAIGCELDRLIYVVGPDSMMKLTDVARQRLREVATREQRLAVQEKLGGRMRIAGVGCDSLAAAGKLGGPYYGPTPSGRAFD